MIALVCIVLMVGTVGLVVLVGLLLPDPPPPLPDSTPGDFSSRASAARHKQAIVRDWRAHLAARRAAVRAEQDAQRHHHLLMLQRNYPEWIVDLALHFNAPTYEACEELARFVGLVLIYADANCNGKLSVRICKQYANQIMPVQNPSLHSREFFEALGQALEAQGLVTANRGNRGRRVEFGALDRLARQLPSHMAHQLVG